MSQGSKILSCKYCNLAPGLPGLAGNSAVMLGQRLARLWPILALALALAGVLAGCADKRPPTPVRQSGEPALDSPESVIRKNSSAIAAGNAQAPVYQERGEAYYRMGQYDLAQKDFEKAQSGSGPSAQALYDLGAAAYMRQDYDKALALFGDALAVDGGMARAYNNRGVTYFALGQYDKAAADFATASKLAGNGGAASLFNRALAEQALRDYDRALADYDRVLAVDPAQTAALNNKADILITLHRFDEAAATLDRAVGIAPNDPDLYFNRALARELAGQFPTAMADYDMALRLRSTFAEGYRNRGVLRLRLHLTKEGCADLALACQFGLCKQTEKAKNFGLCQ